MENQKSRVLTAAIVIAIGLFFAYPVNAYEVNTHAYLTKESIELYNKTTEENKIPDELKRYIIDGSIHEDNDPRYLNHFYDPINDKGLLGGITSAKEWANDEEGQDDIEYKLIIKTSLSPADKQKIDSYGRVTNFTWNAALRYWLKGDKEMAMETLGHALHLIEDMGVPEHTRNDAHGGVDESAYEKYAMRYDSNTPDGKLEERLDNKKPVSLKSLDKYFDGLAKYSNKYFYSPDSIGEYDFPELDYKNAESKEGKYYITNKDDEGIKYYLAIKKNIANVSLGYTDVFVDRQPILESYWSLLSVRTVRYSAGVIDLFFEEVEEKKNDPDFLKEEAPKLSIVQRAGNVVGSIWNGTKSVAVKTVSFFGSVLKTIGNGVVSGAKFVGGLFSSDNGLSDAGNVELEGSDLDTGSGDQASKSSTPSAAAAKKDAVTKKNAEIDALKLQIAGLQKDAQAQDKAVADLEKKQAEVVAIEADATSTERTKKIPASAGMINTPVCAFGSINRTEQKSIVINEVAWMGGVRSASDEWIELKNVSGNDVDVSGWQLLNKGGGIKIRLSELKNTVIKPGQFILLERTDNNSAVGATASLIYSGALGNTNDGLKLFNVSCGVADEVAVSAHWPAGNNDSKQTMERNTTGSGWHTSSSAGGTPKKENSAGVVYSSGGGGSVVSSNSNARTQDSGSEAGMTQNSAPQFYPIVINEIMYDLPDTDSDREWVELHNTGSTTVDIAEWKLFENDTNHALTLVQGVATMPVDGYAIIAQNKNEFLKDNTGFEGSIFESAFSLNNDGESIALKNGTLNIDSVTYASSTGAYGDGRSLQKFDNGWLAASSTPGRVNIKDTVLIPQDPGSEAGMTNTQDDNATTTESATTTITTSTILWDGGAQSGVVYDLFTDRWVGQRVGFASGVDVGTLELGYYNDRLPGLVDATIFDSTGTQRWTTSLVVPRISYGGFVSHNFSEALRLEAGDYFIGSRLVSGSIGIRKGYGSNPCGVSVYVTGDIPSCDDGNDVSMRVGRFVSNSTQSTSTDEIPDQVRDDSNATSTTITSTGDDADIVINEIMYDLPGADEGREWIELYNNGATTADIAEWKFYEDETNHGLTVKQGNSSISAGEYAIVANDSDMFLADNAGYAGTLIDSTFSLSNGGETLSLKNGDLVIDAITYTATTSADGTGMSLQKFSDGWHAASSTPGAENILAVFVQQPQDSGSEAGMTEVSATTTTATTTELVIDNATSTDDGVNSLVLTQNNSDTRSASEPVSIYVQGIGANKINEIKSFKVYVAGAPGLWRGGVCELGSSWPCNTGKPIYYATAQQVIADTEAKTLLTFDFANAISLSPDTNYGLFLEPPIAAGRFQNSSIYGSAGNAYDGGSLWNKVRYFGYPTDNGYPGIDDIYFEIN